MAEQKYRNTLNALNAVYKISNTKRNAHQAAGILKHYILIDMEKIKIFFNTQCVKMMLPKLSLKVQEGLIHYF